MTKLLKNWALIFILAASAGAQAAKPAAPPAPAEDYSGMYTFLHEGEFVQLTVEDDGHLNGFISRLGDQESDRGSVLDHFFKVAKLEGHQVSFTTTTIHDVRFEFKGTVDRGPAKTRAQEGYYAMKGTLTEYVTDLGKKESARTREVEFKLFPEDATLTSPKHE